MDNADPAWVEKATAAIKTLASTGNLFTADHLHERVGPPPGDHRAIGGVIRSARNDNLIEVVGWVKSRRPEAHSRTIPLYKGRAA